MRSRLVLLTGALLLLPSMASAFPLLKSFAGAMAGSLTYAQRIEMGLVAGDPYWAGAVIYTSGLEMVAYSPDEDLEWSFELQILRDEGSLDAEIFEVESFDLEIYEVGAPLVPVAVPEPGTALLLAGGVALLAGRRRLTGDVRL